MWNDKVIVTIFEPSWMLIAFLNFEAMFVYRVTLTASFMKIADKKGRYENIMFYSTFYCEKKYILMNYTKLLFKQNL